MSDISLNVDQALAEVPVNVLPLLDDTDFKTREEAVPYNAAGLELIFHFTDTDGATTATVVTPTTGGGNYDWAHQDGGLYTIKIPASGGASINNDREGFGWFSGIATGVLPFRGPTIQFTKKKTNDALVNGTEYMPVDAFEQKFDISGSTLQPKKPDGTTNTSYSKTLSSDAAAAPIIGSN